MRTVVVLCVLAILFFPSCQKEISYTNEGGDYTDTSALGKFIKATGITDAALKADLDSLIIRARNHGWWDLCKVIYPFAGGTQTSCKYNLKDPRDLDAAFRISFIGSTWTFTSSSANPGDSSYGNTHFNASTQISDPNSCHLSVYSMNDNAGGNDNADIGAYDHNTATGFYLSTRTAWPDSSGRPFAQISSYTMQGTLVNGAGYFLMTKTSAFNASFYRNSSVIKTDTAATPGNLPNLDLFLGNQNYPYGGEPYSIGFSQRGLSFATIGSGIDNNTATLMYSDISDFVNRK
jgi:hypothetical protein